MAADSEAAPALWDQVRLQAESDRVLLSSSASIRQECAKEHNKNVLDCQLHYSDLLGLMRKQFLSFPDSNQWFSTRRAFLDELDDLLTKGADYQVHYKSIDERIEAEKRRWLLLTLNGLASSKTLAEDALGKTEFRERVADRNIDMAELLKEVASAAKAKRPDDVAEAEAHAQSLVDDLPGERIRIYKEILFPQGVPDNPKAQEAARRLDAGEYLDQILNEAQEASERARIKEGKDKALQRIKEIRRGKAANEAQKMKKKGSTADEASITQDDMFPCAECSKAPKPGSDQMSCALCWIEARVLNVRENGTSWCSSSCFSQGYPKHMENQHPCESGDKCLEKEEAASHADAVQNRFCKECVESFAQRARYCRELCANRDFPRHHEAVHIPQRKQLGDDARETEGLVLGSYDEVLKEYRQSHPAWPVNTVEVRIEEPL